MPLRKAAFPAVSTPAWLAGCSLLVACSMLGSCRTEGKPSDESNGPNPDTEADDTGVDTVPPRTGPWQRTETAAPGSITFTEILYNAPADPGLEWIELHNPMALDMDLSGWSLAGGVSYTFEAGTVLPAGAYLVVAADPARVPDAVGPYVGSLSNSGERLELYNNGGNKLGRRIDTVAYADDEPWTVLPDGSGLSLAKIDPDAASDHAENWTASSQLGGTPGSANLVDPTTPPTTVELVALESPWSYDSSGDYPADDWASADYDDSGWEIGDAIFYAGGAQEAQLATIRVTADNYYGVYLGQSDGSDLRLVGQSDAGDWTTVESVDVTVTPEDHLYLAAWEAPWDYGGPQMVIGEVELSDSVVGTSAANFEWTLGTSDACPGTTPTDPPPTEDTLTLLTADANAAGSWAIPAIEADRTASPWGWAIGGSFTDGTEYIWADTFDEASVTNTENTYALFRSTDTLLGSRGATELTELPTTITFRTTFSFDADPASATLALAYLVDDGAIVYLNGVEVLRENLPSGPVDATTRASAVVSDATQLYADIPADALVRGLNVLTVEVHQAEPPDASDADMTFGCALTARIAPQPVGRSVLLNEIAASSDAPFWVELIGASPSAQDLGGLVLASSTGDDLVLPAANLDSGALYTVADVGFPVAAGDVLFLYNADRSALLDAVRVQTRPRGRADDAGEWRTPSVATPSEPNRIDIDDNVVINEIQYHHAPLSEDGTPVTAQPEEWIELYNRGAEYADLSGYLIADAVSYAFPAGTVIAPGAYLVVSGDSAAFRAAYPDIPVVGDFEGNLDNGSDRVLLLDALGNPADEVRYYDDGRWPAAADGGGSTLELADPRADNRAAESWSASDERARSTWKNYRYRSEADPSAVGPDGVWNELVLGLLDSGEVLIDDVSVVQDPNGTPVQLVQNGGFDDTSGSTSDSGAATPAHWRLLGNHRHSAVVPDPDAPGNNVLRLVATGPTGHMHNHAETTLTRTISARVYEVSFRARSISGSNQLNSRLYFNRMPQTTLVQQATLSGTPGKANSTFVANAGPTFTPLHQDVAVPAPYQPVTMSLTVADPDGVARVTLRSSVDGAAFVEQAMTETVAGTYQATLAGQDAGAIVQVYVEAEDTLGARAAFPAAGADSRALLTFDDGSAATNGLHNFRILMTQSDSDWLHDDVNLMSDDLVGATVIYEESQVYYNVGIRAKGSERGRPEVPRLGYGVGFNSEQPFRGSHSSVLIDRSEGVGYGQREVLMNLVMTHAGSDSGEYNDLIQAITPLSEHTGPAELQLDRFTDLVLDSQFTDGATGALYEYELVYYPTTTDDGTAEGLKLPAPDGVIGTAVTDLGDNPESYRWNFLLQNNEREDDYTHIIALGKAFSLSGSDFLDASEAVIDVDQWLRAFAFATLAGAVDNYGGDGSQHNGRFYVRPEDQKVLYFPHDMDFYYYGGQTMAVVGNGDLSRLIADPINLRTYYGHLNDILTQSYNADYLAPWCEQMAELLPAQDIAGHCQFIAERADWVMNGASDSVMNRFPPLEFRITTGGADLAVTTPEATLQGEAWIDVRAVMLAGATDPLPLTWIDDHTFEVVVPLVNGANNLTLVATDRRGVEVGRDDIVVVTTASP